MNYICLGNESFVFSKRFSYSINNFACSANDFDYQQITFLYSLNDVYIQRMTFTFNKKFIYSAIRNLFSVT